MALSKHSFEELNALLVLTEHTITGNETDQFGHLNFGDMQKLITRERIRGIDECFGLNYLTMKEDGVFFQIGEQFTKVVHPSYEGEKLNFVSWTKELKASYSIIQSLVYRKNQVPHEDSQYTLLAFSEFSLMNINDRGRPCKRPEFISSNKPWESMLDKERTYRSEFSGIFKQYEKSIVKITSGRQLEFASNLKLLHLNRG